MTTETNQKLEKAQTMIELLSQSLNNILIGQDKIIQEVICALISRGHILMEGVPGIGKTLLVRSLSKLFQGEFNRIQFTPDLMPSDITGSYWFDQSENKFILKKGPVFTNLLLADEINRAPAKTQAALLEVMQEYSVTMDGTTHQIHEPFMVMATQNPIEQEGTYPLPEAQLDRFMFKILIDYPSSSDEKLLLQKINDATGYNLLNNKIENHLSKDDIIFLQDCVSHITIDPIIFDYIVELVQKTRHQNTIAIGAGPRASIALMIAAKSWALMNKRTYVIPDDVKDIFLPVIRHRVRISTEMEMEGLQTDEVLMQLVNQITAPRQ